MPQDSAAPITIVAVDDETAIAELIADYLGKQGFRVLTADGGPALFDLLEQQAVDLVLLDLMMPGEDGLSVCRRLRAQPDYANLPVIMVTAMSEDIDRIIGLELGADDYIAKPFNPRELAARVKAVLRRSARPEPQARPHNQTGERLYGFADWRLDLDAARLHNPDGEEIELTAGEFNLLTALVEAAPRVLSRDHLLDLTAGREATPFDRAIDIQISRLRQKLEPNPKAPTFIRTVRSQGYAFAETVVKLSV